MYLESSALLSLWFGEPGGDRIAEAVADATAAITSDLTRIECQRAFLRRRLLRSVNAAQLLRLQARAEAVWSAVHMLGFGPQVCARAGEIAPETPVRTLDALHLAFFEQAHTALHADALLSLDERLRSAARELGLAVMPA